MMMMLAMIRALASPLAYSSGELRAFHSLLGSILLAALGCAIPVTSYPQPFVCTSINDFYDL